MHKKELPRSLTFQAIRCIFKSEREHRCIRAKKRQEEKEMNRQSLRKASAISLLCVFVFSIAQLQPASAASSLTHETRQVSISGGTRSIQLVWADLNNPNIRIQNAIANGQLLNAAPLRSIAESVRQPEHGELAAVNGAFFDPAGPGYGGSNVYYGIIMNGGQNIKIGGNETVMGFDANNNVRMGQPGPSVKIHREGAGQFELPLDMWAFNHTFNNSEERVLYTSAYGATTPPATRISVVVRNGVVTQILSGPGPIHSDGFTLASNGASFIYTVGDRLSYSVTYADPSWAQYPVMVAGGPIIVENGRIRTDYQEQGYWDPKIHSNAAARSFIGVTADKMLFVGTVGNATVAQTAEIALSLGAVNAMNLDGGASSSLYFGGRYLTSPGRDLVTAIVITETGTAAPPAPPAQTVPPAPSAPSNLVSPSASTVYVDGSPVAFEAYLIGGNNYFKLRDLAFALNGTPKQFSVGFDPATRAITLTPGEPYMVAGGELVPGDGLPKAAMPSASRVFLDGRELSLTVYTIGGNNFFRLRDLMQAANVFVGYDAATRSITLDPGRSYVEN